MRRKPKKNIVHNGKWFLCLVLLLLVAIYSSIFTERIVKPNLTAIAEVKVRAMMAQIVNNAVHEEFKEDSAVRDLLLIKTDQEGNITYVESNTAAMNNLAAELAQAVQKQYQWNNAVTLEVPWGSIVGSPILSQVGPRVGMQVQPIGMSRANFKTEFESMGINQTKYKVYLQLDSQARVLAPFSVNNIEVQNTILIAEAIIVGKVPNSYINVPAGSAMDATNFFTDE